MSRIVKFASLLLIALWLPATLHCKLEGLGLNALFSCPEQAADTEHADEKSCTADSCQMMESGQFAFSKSRIVPAILPAPTCFFALCLLQIAPPARAPETFALCWTEPLPLQRTWQFTRRAALLARAPDRLNT